MFKLIKWIVILGFIAITWYSIDFYLSLPIEEKQVLKRDAVEAIDQGDINLISDRWSKKVKDDLSSKKTDLIGKIKEKLKNAIDGR